MPCRKLQQNYVYIQIKKGKFSGFQKMIEPQAQAANTKIETSAVLCLSSICTLKAQ